MRTARLLSVTFIVLLLGVGLGVGRAQTSDSTAYATLFGAVTDEAEQPLQGVLVLLQGTSYMDETDRRGRYRIDSVPTGRYRLVSYYEGYQTEGRAIVLEAGPQRIDLRKSGLNYRLEEIEVTEERGQDFALRKLQAVEGASIYEGKKTEVVELERIEANKAANNARQVFARVSGINVWQADYGGVQLSVGGRGLNPKRTSNFNTRQNGYDIAADALGYPESYYTPPMEALERIEVVRGAASLQYGTQFGGMINFVLDDHHDSLFSVKSAQTMGSFGLFNSFNNLSGTVRNGQGEKKASYYGFYQHKEGDGWRPNSGFDLDAVHADVHLFPSDRLTLDIELTHYAYLAQQPGGLTYDWFLEVPDTSTRKRNYFKVDWNIAAVQADYRISDQSHINLRTFGLLAGRQSLGFRERANRPDPADPDFVEAPEPDNAGYQRDLLKGFYQNWGAEARYLTRYSFLGNPSAFLLGTRYYEGFSEQKQGFGSVYADPDFSFVEGAPLRSDYDFPSRNLAVFAENVFSLTSKLSLVPGLRFEYIDTEAEGAFTNMRTLGRQRRTFSTFETERRREREFLLAGLGLSYKLRPRTELYANFSQNYRAITFNDIQIVSPTFEVDSNIQDESGYTADLGLRGVFQGWLAYDVTGYFLNYDDRISTVQATNELGIAIRRRTNLEQARIWGFEGLLQARINRLLGIGDSTLGLGLFVNAAFTEGLYNAPSQKAIDGNDVEHVPPVNLKTGIDLQRGAAKLSVQYTYVAGHFNDATNARVDAVSSAVVGTIPSYQVVDLSASYRWRWLEAEAGVNNLLDEDYFTFRAKGYPGPGIIPSPPRNFYLGLTASWARW
jgi:Fe(3+) dicitrate transport protein